LVGRTVDCGYGCANIRDFGEPFKLTDKLVAVYAFLFWLTGY